MPPRLVVAAIVVGWVAAVAWLASDKWRPDRTDQAPAFVVELADEVAPQHASWILYRDGKRAGSAETRMAPRKDGRFDLTTRLRDFELDSGAVRLMVTSFQVTRTVTRTGELVSVDARASNVQVRGPGPDLKIDAGLKGRVTGAAFQGSFDFDPGTGRTTQPLSPIPIIAKTTFSPYLPLAKYAPLRPGQTWRASNVDPVGEILYALRPVLGRRTAEISPLPDRRPPAEVIAQVEPEAEELTAPRGQQRTCWVIVFRADGMTAKTWVDVVDGKVMRQEAIGPGETIALVRN